MARNSLASRPARWARLAAISIAGLAGTSAAHGLVGPILRPTSLFIQAGSGDQSTHAYVAGATWSWKAWHGGHGWTASAYFEADVGRWSTDEHGRSTSAWTTQLGLTPVLRIQPTGSAQAWFAEIGVGANEIVPLYQTGHKRFSTEFNFGDHFGIGRRLGRGDRQELVLRVQHFSNAGIAEPNPGENFVQLRYALLL